MDHHQDQASVASIDAPAVSDGQLPEQSRHVLKGRADVERVRRRKLGMRLGRAIVFLALIDAWMISRTSHGLTARVTPGGIGPGRPHWPGKPNHVFSRLWGLPRPAAGSWD